MKNKIKRKAILFKRFYLQKRIITITPPSSNDLTCCMMSRMINRLHMDKLAISSWLYSHGLHTIIATNQRNHTCAKCPVQTRHSSMSLCMGHSVRPVLDPCYLVFLYILFYLLINLDFYIWSSHVEISITFRIDLTSWAPLPASSHMQDQAYQPRIRDHLGSWIRCVMSPFMT